MPTQKDPIVVKILSVAKGINQRTSPWALGQEEAVSLENLDISRPGARKKSAGTTSVYAHASRVPKGLTVARSTFSDDVDNGIWAVFSKSLYLIRGNGQSQQYPLSGGSPVDEVLITRDALDLLQFESTQYKNEPAITIASAHRNNTDPTLALSLFTMSISDPEDYTTSTGAGFTSMVWWQNRLWLGHNLRGSAANAIDGSDLHWSDLGAPHTNYGAGANQLQVEPHSGGRIIALTPVREATNPSLIVWKERLIADFWPQWQTDVWLGTAGALDTTASRVRVLSKNIGCIANKSIQMVPTGRGTDIFFLSNDLQVRSLMRVEQDVTAGAGVPVSIRIPDIMSRINIRHASRSVSALADNFYYLAVPVDGSEVPNLMLAYDLLGDSWSTVDLGKDIRDMAAVNRFGSSKSKPYLFVQCNESTADTTYTQSQTGYHVFRTFDEEAYEFPATATPVSEEVTPAISFGDLSVKKRWSFLGVQAVSSSQASSVLSVEYSLDGMQFTAYGNLTFPQITSGSQRAYYTRKLSLEDINPGYTIQFRLKESTKARLSVMYTEVGARVIDTEFDNSIT